MKNRLDSIGLTHVINLSIVPRIPFWCNDGYTLFHILFQKIRWSTDQFFLQQKNTYIWKKHFYELGTHGIHHLSPPLWRRFVWNFFPSASWVFFAKSKSWNWGCQNVPQLSTQGIVMFYHPWHLLIGHAAVEFTTPTWTTLSQAHRGSDRFLPRYNDSGFFWKSQRSMGSLGPIERNGVTCYKKHLFSILGVYKAMAPISGAGGGWKRSRLGWEVGRVQGK